MSSQTSTDAKTSTPSTPREMALALLDAGLTPLPTRSRPDDEKKRTAVSWKEFETRLPTREEVEGWYRDDPGRGVALLTGPNILVVDVDLGHTDPTHDGDPGPFVGTTPAVQRSPNGGFHFIYKIDGAGTNVHPGTGLRTGIDLRTRNSYIVLAPTQVPANDGKVRAYSFEPGALEALLHRELPDAMSVPAVRELLEKKPEPAKGEVAAHEDWITKAMEHPELVSEGKQESTFSRLVWYWRCTVPQDIARATLLPFVRGLVPHRQHEPWTDDHLDEKLTAAYAKPFEKVFATLIDDVPTQKRKREPLTREQAVAKVVAQFRSAKERANDQEPDVDWIVPLFLQAGTLADIHSHPKVGKSTLISYLVKAVVTGGTFLGQQAVKGKVLWFTEQPRPTFKPLLQDAGLLEHPDLFLLHHHEVVDASWSARVAAIVQVAKEKGAQVVIIDTFTKLAGIRGEEENSSGPTLTALDELEIAKEAKLAVLLVRHDRKAGGDAVSGGRGSNAVAGEADFLFQLVKANATKHGANARWLNYEGRLSQIPAERLVVLGDTGYVLADAGSGAVSQQAKDWTAITAVAPGRYADRVTGQALAKQLAESIGKNKVNTRLAEFRALVARGYEPEPGELCFEEAGRGGFTYWRSCLCRIEPSDGTDPDLLGTWVTDPACGGHDPRFPGSRPPVNEGARERRRQAAKSKKSVNRRDSSASSGAGEIEKRRSRGSQNSGVRETGKVVPGNVNLPGGERKVRAAGTARRAS